MPTYSVETPSGKLDIDYMVKEPGKSFIHHFQTSYKGHSWDEYVEYLLTQPQIIPILSDSRSFIQMRFVPGHLWGDTKLYGPRPSRVMLVGKMLGVEEQNALRHFVGPSGQQLRESLLQAGFSEEEINGWYVTNVLKTMAPSHSPDQWKQSWVIDQRFLLDYEMARVQPEIILCIGSEALKAVLMDRGATLKLYRGRVEIKTLPSLDEHQPPKEAKVVCCTHPAQVLRYPSELMGQFEQEIRVFADCVRGQRTGKSAIKEEYHVVRTEVELAKLLQTIEAHFRSIPAAQRILAIDCEWHGQHPVNQGSFLRTIQCSWDYGKAAVIVIRDTDGKPCFINQRQSRQPEPVIARYLHRLFSQARLAGAFCIPDLEWLHVKLQLPVQQYWRPASSWEKVEEEGAIDIALAAHALDELDEFDLTGQVLRHTDMEVYDAEIQKFLKEDPTASEGFGRVPEEILLPYALRDADATYRIARRHLGRIRQDNFGNDCRKPFWLAQRASMAALEMRLEGVVLDMERYRQLAEIFVKKRNELRDKIRAFLRWPELNLDSSKQVSEALFGRWFNNTFPNSRLRPPGARSLRLWPVLTTGKPPKEFMEAYLDWRRNPRLRNAPVPSAAVSYQVLQLLKFKQEAPCHIPGRSTMPVQPLVDWLIDFRLVNQMLKTVLCDPTSDEGLQERGLASFLCSDGRIRTTFYQTKETGRWSSARPPLQNLSKRKEEEYVRLLGEDYKYSIRSLIRAPEGHLLVDADYVGAELVAMAIASGDKQLLEDVRRNQLDETDPDYLDIHSYIACLTFGYDCPPTKAGLKSIGKLSMRIVAKAVIFGLFYGRGAKAIALGSQMEGIEMPVSDAQKIIDTIYARYPQMRDFQEACRSRVMPAPGHKPPMFVATAFGRFRRFRSVDKMDSQAQGEIERQALNAPIQGMVADAVNTALGNLVEYRQECRIPYKILLQIHDAILLAVPVKYVDRVVREVLPECLVRRVPIYRTDLDGRVISNEKHYMTYSYSICQHWEEPLSDESRQRLGITVPASGTYRP